MPCLIRIADPPMALSLMIFPYVQYIWKFLNVELSEGFRYVSWRQKILVFWSVTKIFNSSKLALKPRQFHWIILSVNLARSVQATVKFNINREKRVVSSWKWMVVI